MKPLRRFFCVKMKITASLNAKHGGLVKEILERDFYRCVLCESKENLNIDHITPVRKGGKSIMSNQRTLCAKCHSIITNGKEEKELTYQGRYQREWKTKNPEYYKEYFKKWRTKHPKYYSKYSRENNELYRQANII